MPEPTSSLFVWFVWVRGSILRCAAASSSGLGTTNAAGKTRPGRPCMDHSQIVVVGSYNRDVSLSVARLPAPGETCLSLGRLESPGGKVSNQAIAAARAGARTAMVAAIGTDGAGDE